MNRKDLPKIIRDLVTIAIVIVVIMIASAAFFIVLNMAPNLNYGERWLYSTILIVIDLTVVLVIVYYLSKIAMISLYNWIPKEEEDIEA